MHRALKRMTTFDDALAELVADLVATMYAADGVGLAANQIGVDAAVFVFDCPDDDHNHVRGIVCNPVLELPEGKDRNLDDSEEGCLSLPGAFADCARPDTASVHGVDSTGATVTYTGSGLLARCLQHESDHLSGVVFADRLPERARKQLRERAAELTEDFPAHWPAAPKGR